MHLCRKVTSRLIMCLMFMASEDIFLMATIWPVVTSMALWTVLYAPEPMSDIIL